MRFRIPYVLAIEDSDHPVRQARHMLAEFQCRGRKTPERVQLDFFAAEPGPMGVAGPEVSAAVRGLVEGKGIA